MNKRFILFVSSIILIMLSFFIYGKGLENRYLEKQLALISKTNQYSLIFQEYSDEDVEKGKEILKSYQIEEVAYKTLSTSFELPTLGILCFVVGISGLIGGYCLMIIQSKQRTFLYELECIINRHYDIQSTLNPTQLKLNEIEERFQSLEKQQFETKEKMKMFIEDVAHQIKTPLTALKLYLELENDDKKMVLVQRIETMVTELIHLSRLEAHAVQFEFHLYSFDELIKEIIVSLETKLSQKQLHLSFQSEPVSLSFDYFWLTEALINLLNNAIEYSPENSCIEIMTKVYDNKLVLEMSDEGKGLSLEDAEHLFDRFYTTKNHHRKETTHMGIGLNIASEVVKAHHGHLFAVARRKGTTFVMELPLNLGKEKI